MQQACCCFTPAAISNSYYIHTYMSESTETAAGSTSTATAEPANVAANATEVANVVAGRPLAWTFRSAQAAYNWVLSSDLSSADAVLQRKIGEGLTLCEAALVQVSKQDIFSPNETIQDVNTGDLKYLLLPFYRGELLLRLADQSKRVAALREALPCLRGFLGDLERLEMLTTENQGWQQMGAAASSDPAAVRTAKIARHKASKAANEKMAAIAEKLAKKAGRTDGDDDEEDDTDELERENLMLMLQCSCHTAIDSIRAAEQEADMLRQIAAMRRPDGSLPPPPTLEEEDPSQGMQMLSLLPGGVPQKPHGVHMHVHAARCTSHIYGRVCRTLHMAHICTCMRHATPCGACVTGGVGRPQTVPTNGMEVLTANGVETLSGFRASNPRQDPSSRLSYATAMRQIHTGEIPGLYTYSVEEGLRMEEAVRALCSSNSSPRPLHSIPLPPNHATCPFQRPVIPLAAKALCLLCHAWSAC